MRNQLLQQLFAQTQFVCKQLYYWRIFGVPTDKAGVPPGVGSRLGRFGLLGWRFQAATSDEAELTYVVDNRLNRRPDAIAGQHQATFQRGNERGHFLVSKTLLSSKKTLTHWISCLILGCGGRIWTCDLQVMRRPRSKSQRKENQRLIAKHRRNLTIPVGAKMLIDDHRFSEW